MSQSPHDSLAKLAFSNPTYAAAELRVVLPAELAQHFDWSTLAVEQGSFVDRALDKSHSDILYSVRLAESPAYVYVLFEHKSFTERLLALALLRYVLRVLEMHVRRFGESLPLPPVIAVVLHHTEEGWVGETDLLSLFGDLPNRVPGLEVFLPQLRFCLDDISHVSDDALRGRGFAAFPTLVLWALRDARVKRKILRTIKSFAHLLNELVLDAEQRDALYAIFRYIDAVVTDMTPEEFEQAIAESAPMTQTAQMTIAEILHQRGFEKGAAAGRIEGQAAGQTAILDRQLAKKFGHVPDWARERLRSASAAELEIWADRVLVADSLDTVFVD